MLKKGFTLIELLAVIIILAIIALIATPIILNVIEDARKSVSLSETYIIYDGINNYCQTSEIKKQMGTLSDEEIDCSDKTTFTEEEIQKMVNLGNAEVLENIFDGTKLTYIKVKSHGYINEIGNKTPIILPPITPECTVNCDDTIIEGTYEVNEDIYMYSVGYLTESHIENGVREVKYTIKLTDLPIDLNKYTLEVVSKETMTTQEDFNKYVEMKEKGKPSGSMEGEDVGASSVATKEELYEHSLGAEQLKVNNIEVSCNKTECEVKIEEKLENLTGLNYHITKTKDGRDIKVVYNGIKFVLRKKERTEEGNLISILLEQYNEDNTTGLVKDNTNPNLYYYTGTNEEVSNNYL